MEIWAIFVLVMVAAVMLVRSWNENEEMDRLRKSLSHSKERERQLTFQYDSSQTNLKVANEHVRQLQASRQRGLEEVARLKEDLSVSRAKLQASSQLWAKIEVAAKEMRST